MHSGPFFFFWRASILVCQCERCDAVGDKAQYALRPNWSPLKAKLICGIEKNPKTFLSLPQMYFPFHKNSAGKNSELKMDLRIHRNVNPDLAALRQTTGKRRGAVKGRSQRNNPGLCITQKYLSIFRRTPANSPPSLHRFRHASSGGVHPREGNEYYTEGKKKKTGDARQRAAHIDARRAPELIM